jgi:hypothetical protein
MNISKIAADNAFLELEPERDMTPLLNEQRRDLVEVIGALEAISGSKYWQILQNKVFQGAFEILQRRLRNEKDSQEILRLQGQIVWMEKYIYLDKLLALYRKDLQSVDKKLNA